MIDNDDGNNVDGNLQHFVGARLDSRHKMSGTERNLLHLQYGNNNDEADVEDNDNHEEDEEDGC